MFEPITNLLEHYGWYIFGISIAILFAYYKYLKPAIRSYFEKQHEAEIKKFGEFQFRYPHKY